MNRMFDTLETFREIEIGRCVVGGIAADDHERLDRTVVHLFGELLEGGRLHGRRWQLDVRDGLARVAQRLVDRQRWCTNRG